VVLCVSVESSKSYMCLYLHKNIRFVSPAVNGTCSFHAITQLTTYMVNTTQQVTNKPFPNGFLPEGHCVGQWPELHNDRIQNIFL
jgi:hypothetical protein